MALAKRYNPQEVEPRLAAYWQQAGIYQFDPEVEGAVFSIDTPPATVSGNLHLGHVYSYSHPDFIARFQRMNGRNVFYPMGFDDNGLATERLIERKLGITATQVGRAAFIEKCLQVSAEAEKDYEALWKRLALSIDWRYSYRTIDDLSRRTSQLSFIQLYREGRAYRKEAPFLWCPECQTAIAQAELEDRERESEYVILAFGLPEGEILAIATTRPELLPACVAVFVHPEDTRYRSLVGQTARLPLYGREVPILADAAADQEKGTGAVMCCTFGDTTDVAWWHTHRLPLIQAVGRDGRMTSAAGDLSGLPLAEARRQIKAALAGGGFLIERQSTRQSIRAHERCDTPVEYIVTRQWFIRLLDEKDALTEAGRQVKWHPEHMFSRYQAWVENLSWDWCISRQRYFGVPFPLWYCAACGEVVLADESDLPVDPLAVQPARPCACGSTRFVPEEDILDTWATSSMTPQIVGRWLDKPELYSRVFPYSLRPQAHEIIRTWAFYTLAKSILHFGRLPWSDALISGWGIAGEGMGKISKSKGGGPMPPLEMIERYSADALRYWAASTSPGKDSIISEEKIQMGGRLVNKLWNVARFAERFLEGYTPPETPVQLSPADRWILSRLQGLVRQVTAWMERYEYAAAKSETENFFWSALTDNYLEMIKQRLYESTGPDHDAARFGLYHTLLAVIKLLAPFLPYVTEEIYQGLFGTRPEGSAAASIHRSSWPFPRPELEDRQAEELGDLLVQIATDVRRFKSEHNLALGSELDRLQLATGRVDDLDLLQAACADLMSVTRARKVEIAAALDPELEPLKTTGSFELAVKLAELP